MAVAKIAPLRLQLTGQTRNALLPSLRFRVGYETTTNRLSNVKVGFGAPTSTTHLPGASPSRAFCSSSLDLPPGTGGECLSDLEQLSGTYVNG